MKSRLQLLSVTGELMLAGCLAMNGLVANAAESYEGNQGEISVFGETAENAVVDDSDIVFVEETKLTDQKKMIQER